mmetsp:Transcript_185/g.573  ORF Transcript_185/g.573 Transcript_185/m.573 type:complete len:233 (+) Transcript_185:1819-2517(+)
MDTHVRLVKVQQQVFLVVEATLGGGVRGFEQRRGGVKISDDDIGLTRASIFQLEPHFRGVLELLFHGAGPGAELLANRSLRAHRLAVACFVANRIRTTHLVHGTVTGVVARGGPVRRRVRFAFLPDALQDLLGGYGVKQDDVRVLFFKQTQVDHQRGEGFTGPGWGAQDDVKRQRRFRRRVPRARRGFVVLVQLLQKLVLVLVHARGAPRLRAGFVRPVVHGFKHLVLDPVG